MRVVRALLIGPRRKAATDDIGVQTEAIKDAPPEARQLKVRIVSWNMHDGLPKVRTRWKCLLSLFPVLTHF